MLLDLPDHDSTEVSHHLEVDRLIGMTDLMVWVLDPQKYADAAIHDRFLKPLASHAEVMLVVLNRIDEVPEDRRSSMLDDVRRLLELDGLGGVPVLTTSALTGEGIPELRRAIGRRVADKASFRARLAGDVSDAAAKLSAHSGDAQPRELAARDQRDLVESLADAAGVPVVVEAVRRASAVRARRATGWPLTAWFSRLKPDPLRRLHLDRGASGKDLVAAARSSMPTTDQVQQARVETTVRDLCDDASQGLTQPWVRSVRRASTSRFADL
ncbi:MAG: transporter, partial [Marmoricola sp.]|nr:transporter [Marmoricola sp.]